ncbi:MAG: pyridoxamine 5'-phosphate oxidase family protein [Planctomycetes bacterium]|nr:pyridoxamine 5'-phosphate oxidase family protein [Planctomycetota bacterium]
MNLSDYFEKVKGTGVLGTADSAGKVDLAIYARPHVMDDQAVAFIMRDRLSHANVVANPHAAYLFIEQAKGYHGLRLYLTRTAEEDDPKKVEAMRRKSRQDEDTGETKAFVVYFRVDEVRPLVGSSVTREP